MSSKFIEVLKEEISVSQRNNYGIENFDEYRFGKYPVLPKSAPTAINKIKDLLKFKSVVSNSDHLVVNELKELVFNPEKFDRLYEALPEKDRSLLVSIMAYRHIGYQRVKLPRNTKQYWAYFEIARTLEDKLDTFDPHYLNFILTKFDLNLIGKDIKLYYALIGIVATFLLEQYAYKVEGKNYIEVEKNDVVFDLGGCWGDTALYFADMTGSGGKVYSFEFIPDNLKLFKINLEFNPHLKEIIKVVDRPVSDNSNSIIYYQDQGPASKVLFAPFEGHTGSTVTISIDDFVKNNNIEKVDFIKMDIEGAEMAALQGAVDTIRRFRPKLAIAVYHSLNDLVDIPNWILDLGEGYDIFLDHFTIHAEETVCFAIAKK